MNFSDTSPLDERIRAALDAAKMALWEFDIHQGVVKWTGNVPSHFLEFSKNFDGTLTPTFP